MKKILLVSLFLAVIFLVTGSVSSAAQLEPQVDSPVVYLPVVLKPPGPIYLPLVSKIDPPKWIGPDGGSIVCLAISASNPNVMYAGTWGSGVFKTTNGGLSWAPVNAGLPGRLINSIAVDPLNENVAYAGPYKQKLYKTVDGGAGWFSVSSGLQTEANVYAIAIDPGVPSRLYIGTRGVAVLYEEPDDYRWNGVVYKSSDSGGSWKPVLVNVGGIDDQDWAYDISVHPYQTNLVLIAMHEYGVRRSTDYGETFNSIYSGLIWGSAPPYPGLSGRAIVFNQSSSPNVAYYGVWHGVGTFNSNDAGQNWVLKNNGSNGSKVYHMAVDPGSPSTAYAAAWNNIGLLKTVDGGEHWTSVGGLAQNQLYTVEVNPASSSTVYTGTLGDGLYRSTNGGSSWSHWQKGIRGYSVNSMLVQPDAAGTVYTSTLGGGISRLDNPAGVWQTFNSGLPEKDINGLARSPATPSLLFALTSGSGLYKVDTSISNTWTATSAGLPSAAADVAPLFSPDHPFASREDMEAEVEIEPEPAYDSNQAEAVSATTSLLTMAFAPSSANTAYLGTADAGVYASGNGGVSWTAKGLPGFAVWSIAVSAQNPSIVYAAARSAADVNAPQRIYYSTSGGTSWENTSLPRSVAYSLIIPPLDSQRIYAGTDNGVYVRVNNGAWAQSGLAGKHVTSLAAHPEKANTLLAGTTIGAYISNNNGQTWASILPELAQYTIQSIAFDPANAHITYFGTTTSGILEAYLP